MEYKKIFKILDKTKIIPSTEYIVLEQFYLNFYPKIICRKMMVPNSDPYMSITTKVKKDNNTAIEFSSNISFKDYEKLKEQSVSKILSKQRRSFTYKDDIFILDKYFGDFNFEIATIEFKDEEELNDFICPDFLEECGDILSIEEIKR